MLMTSTVKACRAAVLSLMILIGSVPAFGAESCYQDGGNSGCDTDAYYDQSEDRTY